MTDVQVFAFIIVPIIVALYGWGIALWFGRQHDKSRTHAE
jgi:hypothetical protein